MGSINHRASKTAVARRNISQRPCVTATLRTIGLRFAGVEMNRLWNLWCELSGAAPDDRQQMKSFNMDRRIATLSAHPAELVHALAVEQRERSEDQQLDLFLDLWLAAVEATLEQERLDRDREQEAKEAERQRQFEFAELQRQAEEEERRQLLELAERERRVQAQKQLAEEREELLAARHKRMEIRHRIPWLYNITAVGNVASIAQHGILCHERAERLLHDDFSNRSVQDRRARKVVAGGRTLHQLASLYFNPRNAMLYQLCMEGHELVVLRVSPDVLDLPGVVVTDGNAASSDSESWLAHEGLENVPLDSVYVRTWETAEEKRIRQAEVLVPDRVHPSFITGFIAPSEAVRHKVQRLVAAWQGSVDSALFFDRIWGGDGVFGTSGPWPRDNGVPGY